MKSNPKVQRNHSQTPASLFLAWRFDLQVKVGYREYNHFFHNSQIQPLRNLHTTFNCRLSDLSPSLKSFEWDVAIKVETSGQKLNKLPGVCESFHWSLLPVWCLSNSKVFSSEGCWGFIYCLRNARCILARLMWVQCEPKTSLIWRNGSSILHYQEQCSWPKT